MKKSALILIIIRITFFAAGCDPSQESSGQDKTFMRAEQQWRQARDQEMRGPESWLSIAGLFWLQPGENSFGSASKNTIVLPPDSALDFAGSVWLENKIILVTALSESGLQHNGEVVTEIILRTDRPGPPDILALKNLRLWVIERSGRYALRLRDLNSPAYKNYAGLEYFPPLEKYQIKAKFVQFSEPKTISLLTMVGLEADFSSPGYLSFHLDGLDLRLDTILETPGASNLFIIFADKTSGEETYGGGRFLDAYFLDNQTVDLNFNHAINPPCAYTPHATCPLPSEQNILPLRIEAGEKNYPGISNYGPG